MPGVIFNECILRGVEKVNNDVRLVKFILKITFKIEIFPVDVRCLFDKEIL